MATPKETDSDQQHHPSQAGPKKEAPLPGPAPAQASDNQTALAASNTNDDALGKRTELSAEEQMALYEKALKEDDWGHQPC